MNPRAAHFGAQEVDLNDVEFTKALLACIPAKLVWQCRVLPVFDSSIALKVAIADPADLTSIDSLRSTLHRDIEICVAEEGQMEQFMERFYGPAKNG